MDSTTSSGPTSMATVLLTELRYIHLRRRGWSPTLPEGVADHELWEKAATHVAQTVEKWTPEHLKGKKHLTRVEEEELLKCEEEELLRAWKEALKEAGGNEEKNAQPYVHPEGDKAANDLKLLDQNLLEAFKLDDDRNAYAAQSEPRDPAQGKELEGREAELLRTARARAHESQLTGLAFSGGGIRSATFCLGFLQGLADSHLLSRFDYLSTVSGGGYIGSWLTAWIKREGRMDTVENQLRTTRSHQAKGRLHGDNKSVEEEPEPIFHLRSYSNYLAPHPSLLSADSWVLLAIYFRNFLLNQLLLLPLTLMVLLVARLGVAFYYWDGGNARASWLLGLGGLTGACLVAAMCGTFRALLRLRNVKEGHDGKGQIQQNVVGLNLFILVPLLISAVIFCWFSWEPPDPLCWDWFRSLLQRVGINSLFQRMDSTILETTEPLPARSAVVFGLVFGLLFAFLHLIFFRMFAVKPGSDRDSITSWDKAPRPFASSIWWITVGFVSGFGGGALLSVLLFQASKLIKDSNLPEQGFDISVILTLGPPAALLIFVLACICQVGLLGRQIDENAREWWASLCGWVGAYAIAWAAIVGIALFGMPLLIWAGPMVQALAGAGWITTAFTSVMAGRSPRSGSEESTNWRDVLAQIGPYVFIFGLLIAMSGLASWVIDMRPDYDVVATMVENRKTPETVPTKVTTTVTKTFEADPGTRQDTFTQEHSEQPDVQRIKYKQYYAGLLNTNPILVTEEDLGPDRASVTQILKRVGIWLIGCLAVVWVASWRIGVNVFSLHAIYGNRLIRCYLGASRLKGDVAIDRLQGMPPNSAPPPRRPNPITGLDPNDDFPLRDLVIGPSLPRGGNAAHGARQQPYWGPYPLINTALNLTEGDELAWQERKAEAFVFTPRYCGSKSTGYRSLPEYGQNVTLGTAVTISGAAASPNMGYHSSPAVTALLTLFNVRLGAWLGNPRKGYWKFAEPRMAVFQLLKELFGRTNRRSAYVYLSDGGHFENLGVYELIRRRCFFIVVCDAGEDPHYRFFDLGGLIRKCRSDLGITISMKNLDSLVPNKAGESQCHFAIGTIDYSGMESDRVSKGYLVYVKPTLTKDVPSDVLNYRKENPSFPHQSTGNQFFTESQFESYRSLGHHIASEFKKKIPQADLAGITLEAPHSAVVNSLRNSAELIQASRPAVEPI